MIFNTKCADAVIRTMKNIIKAVIEINPKRVPPNHKSAVVYTCQILKERLELIEGVLEGKMLIGEEDWLSERKIAKKNSEKF